MGLLDRLRPLPKYRHADPAVRLAAVQELDDQDLDALPAIAKEDPDPTVRKAAADRIDDPAVLVDLAASDADLGVRARASEILVDLSVSDADEPKALTALEGLARTGNSKALQAIAKEAALESVSRAALAELTDAKAIGSVARQGTHASVRLEALSRVDDPAERAAIALKTDHKDVALAALESIADAATLDTIATRAKNKIVARRARAMLRSLQPVAADGGSGADTGPDLPDEEEHAEVVDFAKVARDQEEQERKRQALEAQERALEASRREADQTRQRQEEEAAVALRGRLDDLMQQAAAAVELPETAAALDQWRSIRQAWRSAAKDSAVDAALTERYQELDARFAERERTEQQVRVQRQRETFERLQQLADRAERIAQNEAATLKEAERVLRDLRMAQAQSGPVPSKEDHQVLVDRFRKIQEVLVPKVDALRRTDEWERWANAGMQEEICKKVEALRDAADPAVAARHLRDAKEEWKKIGPVPAARAQSLWLRLKAAEEVVRAQCAPYFAEQAEARRANLSRKEALCEQAEGLAESTSWIATAETIKGLQAEWKTIGPALPGHEKALWERFRRACDRFFTRRKADLADRKHAWAVNLAKKEELCQQAEALADSMEWDRAAAELRRLQADWKAVGPVKRTRAEAIWQRFRAAGDRFFERYAQRDQLRQVAQVTERERLCQDLEALAPPPGEAPAPPANLLQRIQGLRTQWLAAPIPRHQVDPLAHRFLAGIAQLIEAYPGALKGSDVDPQANRQKLEQLCTQVEGLVGPDASIDRDASPAAILAKQWREALAANTIGGKVDEDAKWRQGIEQVRRAQQAWRRVWPVPEEAEQPLADRFQRACQKFYRRRDERQRPSSVSAR